MLADVALAGLAHRRMRLVGLLHHRAEQAGELGQLALKDRLAEIDVAEHVCARVGQPRVRGRVEDRVGACGEMCRGRDGAGFLAGENGGRRRPS